MGKDLYDLIVEHLAQETGESLDDLITWVRTLFGKSERDELVYLLGRALVHNLDSRTAMGVFAEALLQLAEIEEAHEARQCLDQ